MHNRQAAAHETALLHPLWPQLLSSATPEESRNHLGNALPLRRLQPLHSSSPWKHHDGHLPVSSLQMVAMLGSPFLLETSDPSHHWLLLSHDGQLRVEHPWGTALVEANGGLILPARPWTLLTAGDSSLTLIGFDPLRLLPTARVMAPAGWTPPPLHQSPLLTPLMVPEGTDLSCTTLLGALGLMLPAIGRMSQLGETFLEPFLLEQQLYRLLAALVFPTLRNNPESPAPATDGSRLDTRLDRVLDYISLHLDRPLPLSVLEAQSNYCRRSLHYAFQQRFGCSPMQWIRQQRMELALQQLQEGQPGLSSVRAVGGPGLRLSIPRALQH